MKVYEATQLCKSLPNALRDMIWSCKDNELMIITGLFQLDIMKLDKLLGKNDPEYDNVKCYYRGVRCSPSEYIQQKYGYDVYNIVKKLLIN